MKTKISFEEHLRKSNLSENTITSYLWTVEYFQSHYDGITSENLLAYKGYLMEFFKPKTVNLRIQGMNKYLEFLGYAALRLKAVKVQQKNFLENVISNADYNFLKKQLKKDGNMEWYFVIWYLAATGARVSELIQIKVEHVEIGYFDLYTKGGKLRRLYIPKKLRTETMTWLEETNRSSGYLFSIDMVSASRPVAFLNSSRTMLSSTVWIRRWSIRTLSVIATPRIFLKSTMTLLCLPTSWDMKASKQPVSISAELPASSKPLSIKLSLGKRIATLCFQ